MATALASTGAKPAWQELEIAETAIMNSRGDICYDTPFQRRFFSMLLFTDEDLQRVFLPAYLKRGRDYQAFGRVKQLAIDADGRRIGAAVQGGAKRPYRTDIILSQTRKGVVRIEGSCSCPMVYNCKHVAATLLEALERQEPEDSEEAFDDFEPAPVAAPARPALNYAVQGWIENLARAAHGRSRRAPPIRPWWA